MKNNGNQKFYIDSRFNIQTLKLHGILKSTKYLI